jgi:hypothetical protein
VAVASTVAQPAWTCPTVIAARQPFLKLAREEPACG